MMSNIPLFETVGVANGSDPVVQLAPMEQTVVTGNFNASSPTDRVQLQLQAGEIFTAGLHVNYPAIGTNWGSALKVYSPGGNPVASQTTSFFQSVASDPITGAQTYDDSVSFQAPSTGLYTVEADENATYASYFGQGNYTLTLRPIELDTSTLYPDANPQDAAKLQFSGGALYAFLNPAQNTLTFSGPTGRGFSISEPSYSSFVETTTTVPGSSLTTTTITGSGTLTLNSALGGIPLPLPPGFELKVTTVANGYNGLFGEVSGAEIDFPYSSVVSDLVNPFGSFLGPQIQQAEAAYPRPARR